MRETHDNTQFQPKIRTFEIEVTQEDIDSGECRNIFQCPIARAIKRRFPYADHSINAHGDPLPAEVSVGYHDANVHYNGVPYRAGVPVIAATFINDYDRGLPVKPFTFPLTLRGVIDE